MRLATTGTTNNRDDMADRKKGKESLARQLQGFKEKADREARKEQNEINAMDRAAERFQEKQEVVNQVCCRDKFSVPWSFFFCQ